MMNYPAFALALAVGTPAVAANKPNVVVILADDLGYGDVACYNPARGKIPTPHIDRLAAEGMRFTDAHSSSGVCSPTRYSLLTGRYHWRTKLRQGIVGQWGPPLIAPDRLTLAGLAKQHGYHTACVGKWHLGRDWPIPADKLPLFKGPEAEPPTPAHLAAWKETFSQPIPGGPTTRGFDEYFGTDVPNWPPYCFIENDRTVGVPSEWLPPPLRKPLLAGQPGPAVPDWSLLDVLPKLTDRACEIVRKRAGSPFLLYLPLTSPHTPIVPTANWQGKSGLNAYADLVMQTDAAVGRVLDAVRAAGVADHTLVVFTSDNGCATLAGHNELQAKGHFSSGPFRGYKADAWEGGHRVPFVVRWPGVVRPGTVCDQTVCSVDLMATVADALGAKLPAGAGEDSVSLLPLLKGGTEPVHEAVVHSSAGGVFAVRAGPWKLILGPGSGQPSATPPHLYDLSADIGETTDLAATKPEAVARLRGLMETMIAAGRSTPGPAAKNDVPVPLILPPSKKR